MTEVEEIKSRLDIVEVVSGYLQLQKAGRTFKAPCPFHNERTPSFIVSPDRQSWHCFGACGTGGDVITFVMKREGLEFPEALRLLADRAGVRLPEKRVSEQQDKARQRLYSANEAAAAYFRKLLVEGDAGKSAREYVERRGIDAATAEAFSLGFSLPSWEGLRQHLTSHDFTDRELLSAGLLTEGDRGPHDRFRGRLMFAIRDAKGRVAGFGARALDDSLPKYINTAQNPIFDKGGMLYALDRAHEAIRREERAVVVEGYIDAIAAHQAGFTNVVAQMGTALTERQVRLLKKAAPRLILALDADSAGSEAMVRGHEVVRGAQDESESSTPIVNWRGLVTYQEAASVDLRIAVLPEGRDPDDVIRSDPDLWRRLIDEASPVLDFRFNAACAAFDLSDARQRSLLAQSFLPLLGSVTDPVVRAHYLQKLARASMVDEEELTSVLRKPAARRALPQEPRIKAPRIGDPREEFVIALLLRYPELRREAGEIPENLLWESENRQVFAAYKRHSELEDVKIGLPQELAAHFERLFSKSLPPFDLKQAREALFDSLGKLQRRQLEVEKRATASLLATREEELGAAAFAEAALAESEAEDVENDRELVSLQVQDMETGLRLHAKERNVARSEAG
jgi:DNA primase